MFTQDCKALYVKRHDKIVREFLCLLKLNSAVIISDEGRSRIFGKICNYTLHESFDIHV